MVRLSAAENPSGKTLNNPEPAFLNIFISSFNSARSLPSQFDVTGGGDYCEGTSGVTIGLSGSETGVTYELLLDGSGTGTTIAGTGAALSYTNITQAGIFTILATSDIGSETSLMNGSTAVNVNPKPDSPVSGGNETICSNQSIPTLTVSAGSGETADWYNAVSGGTMVATGTTSYTPPGSGTWYAEARNTTTACISTSRTAVTLTINTLPTVLAVPANQSVCPATAITPIIITNPNNVAGTTYTWTRNNTTILTGIAAGGSGTPISGTLNSTQPNTLQTTTFTITATANACSGSTTATVTVGDITQPVITNCPGNISVNTGSGRPTCDQVATWTAPAATDNCGGSVTWTQTHTSGSLFPVGITTVTYTATDASGNQSICTFSVTVTDNTLPTFTSPANLTIYVNSSCAYNAGTAFTGDVINESDNCTPTGLQATYTDQPPVAGACAGSYIITRGWSLTDMHGNITTHSQTITVADNIKPVLTVPANITIRCQQSILPATTGQATATDNCGGTVTLSYTDNTTAGTCASASTIIRAWTATDCSLNTITRNQLITVIDDVPPTIISTSNVTVACPGDIPPTDPAVITATDNCGPVTIVFFDEIPYGLESQPGYCPYRVDRIYRVTDQCGNYTDATQIITVSSLCGCSPCATSNSFHTVDLTGQPNGSMTFNNVTRQDKCCDAKKEQCVSFNVKLDEDAVGVQISIDGATPSPQDWRIDCESVSIIGNVICIPGGNFYLFTYCKPGGNANNFTFTSIAGIVLASDIIARVSCNTQITIEGTATNPVWNSVSPGAPGIYNGYLSCTSCPNPVFTPDENAPPLILYQVCGSLPTSPCVTAGVGCDTVAVYVYDSIHVIFNVDPGAFCMGNIPLIEATVLPPGTTYTFQWYDAYNGTGNLLGTGSTFQPPVPGPYSLVVTDIQDNIPCSTYTYNFDVAPDNSPPVVTPPQDLILQCNDPDNNQLIQDWLSTATAIDDHTTDLSINNNYPGLGTQTCGISITVTFNATDDCNNTGTASAKITIIDTQTPVWVNAPGNLDRTIECSNAAAIAAAQVLQPTAGDQCDLSLTIVRTAGSFVQGACPQAGTYTNTWTATDDCGNTSANFTQVITITDNTAPVWTSAIGSLNRTIACSDAAGLAVAQALAPASADNCDASLSPAKTAGALVPGSCANSGTYTNTWSVADDCGNTSLTFTQVITLSDAAPPALTTPASAMTVECDGSGNLTELNNWLNGHASAVAVDACGGAVTWTHNFTGLSDLCGSTGAASVTFTATDVCGNSITTTATFTITDTQGPILTCPPDVQAQVDPLSCEATSVDLGNPTYSDVCSTPVTIANNAPVVFPAGITTVTWTATDNCGNLTTCQQIVTVEDHIPPTVDCPDDMNIFSGAGLCSAIVTVPSPVVTNPCPYTVVNDYNGTADASGTYPVGPTTVTWSITGISGNVTTCFQLITVIDNQLPTITCPADVTAIATPPLCEVPAIVVGNPTYADNCPNPLLTWTKTGATTDSGSGLVNNTTFNVGVSVVTYTITDASDNEASCSFNVTVNDQVPPTITECAPAIINASTDAGLCYADLTIAVPLVTDPCNEIVSIINSFNGTSDASGNYPIGTTIVVWTFTDRSGNTSTCSQTINVTDNQLPTITCPGDVTAIATPPMCEVPAIVVGNPTYGDNCLNPLLTWTKTGATTDSGSGLVNNTTFNVGVTIVTYTVTDASGNTASCPFSVTVNDQVPPTVTQCTPAIINASADAGQCYAGLTITPPVVTDPCNEIISTVNSFNGTADASGNYPIGTTIVVWTFTDRSGNISTCSQTINVTDNQLPTITCPADVTAIAIPPLCEVPDVVIDDPTFSDNCSGAVLTWVMTGATTGSGTGILNVTTFNVGVSIIIYTVTDASLNVTSCSFTVTVNDQVPPTITECAPAIINASTDAGLCYADLTIAVPLVTDPCNEIVSIENSFNGTANASDNYPIGTTIVVWTFTDRSGNISTCSQTINVTDNQFPILNCPANMEQEIIGNGCELAEVVITDPTYSDNCGVTILTWAMTGATIGNSPSTGINFAGGETFNVGVTTVTYTASDLAGNTVNCSFTVWIKNLDDPQFTVTCPDDISVPAPADLCEADVTVTAPVIYNPCNEIYTITNDSPLGIDPGGIYPVGITTIHWIITDASGNITPCNQAIRVTDETDPLLTCPPSFSVDADFELPYATNVAIDPPTYSDACGIEFLSWILSGATSASSPLDEINELTIYTLNAGLNTITYTATDVNNNVSTCSFTIFVNSDPEIECQPGISVFNDAGECSASLDPGAPTLISGISPAWEWVMTDASGTIIDQGTGRPITPNPYAFPVGVTTITWTATNVSGTDECSQIITVTDNEPPIFTLPDLANVYCVEGFIAAVYNPGGAYYVDDLAPERRDFYILTTGNTLLDLTGVSDNCPGTITIAWTIDFGNNGSIDLSGSGQISLTTPIDFPLGDNLVTWTVTDTAGNFTTQTSMLIVIQRPDIID